MEKIMEVKSEFSTKEFTLDYDSAKDKYYLSCVAYGGMDNWNILRRICTWRVSTRYMEFFARANTRALQ